MPTLSHTYTHIHTYTYIHTHTLIHMHIHTECYMTDDTEHTGEPLGENTDSTSHLPLSAYSCLSCDVPILNPLRRTSEKPLSLAQELSCQQTFYIWQLQGQGGTEVQEELRLRGR